PPPTAGTHLLALHDALPISVGTRVWIWLLVGSLAIFAGNTIYAMTKASRLGGASTAASALQVNSQRLANQGREAVDGSTESYAADRKSTRLNSSHVKISYAV